jgi:hypothetical protein
MSVSSSGRYVGGSQRLLDSEFDSPTFTLRLANLACRRRLPRRHSTT